MLSTNMICVYSQMKYEGMHDQPDANSFGTFPPLLRCRYLETQHFSLIYPSSTVGSPDEMSSFYLSRLFSPDRFSLQTIFNALQLFTERYDIPVSDIDVIETEAEVKGRLYEIVHGESL